MNKKDLISKSEKLGCTVEIDLYDGRNKTVHITAPKGKNFGGNHTLITTWYSGKASDLYQAAFEDLQSAIVGLCKCDSDTCGSWVDGECEYWAGE